jgi:hypothetical protein
MAITAVRSGSCSMEAVAPEDLEVEVEAGEDDVELEAGLVMLPEEAGKSSQRTKVMKGAGGEDTYSRILVFEVQGQPAGLQRCSLRRGSWPLFVGSLYSCRYRRGRCCRCERCE